MLKGTVQKLVLVLTDAATNAVLERWNFDIIHEKPVNGYLLICALYSNEW